MLRKPHSVEPEQQSQFEVELLGSRPTHAPPAQYSCLQQADTCKILQWQWGG